METFTDTFEVTIRIQALCIHTIQKESQLKLIPGRDNAFHHQQMEMESLSK
jgi:hypothetical protein